MIKFPYFQSIINRINKSVDEEVKKLEIKAYEKYPETNCPGISLSEEDLINIHDQISTFNKKQIEDVLGDDYRLFKKLIDSDEWKLFKKYSDNLILDIEEGTLTEKLAFKQAKMQAINSVLSVPDKVIEYYEGVIYANRNNRTN